MPNDKAKSDPAISLDDDRRQKSRPMSDSVSGCSRLDPCHRCDWSDGAEPSPQDRHVGVHDAICLPPDSRSLGRVSPPLLLERALVCAAVVLTCVLFWRGAADPVNVIKLATVVLLAGSVIAVAAARVIATRTAAAPWSPAGAAATSLILAFTVVAIVGPHGTTALLGATGRNSGLLAYFAALILFLAILRAFDAPSTALIGAAVLSGGLFTALYGLLQYAGGDPIPWSNPFNPIIGTLGNPDFASAYLGIALPLSVWGALSTRLPMAARVAAAVTGGLCAVTAILSSAVQGPIAGAVGCAVVLLAVSLDLEGRVRRRALTGLGAAAAAGIGVLLLGIASIGPAAQFFTGVSYDGRTWYWQAALDMFARSPLTGVGLDSYGIYWWQERPAAAAASLGADTYSDSAHSVPLQHLAQGGLLLALAYAVFTAIIAAALVSGLRRLRGQDRLLLGGLGGAWLAYHVQSVVSIDQVPLLVLHFVLAGAVIVAAGQSRLREFRLPGALPVPPPALPAPKGRKRPPSPRPARVRTLVPLDLALLAGLTIGGLVLAWLSLAPMRATLAIAAGDEALSKGDGAQAVAHYQRAIDLTPGRGAYLTKIAIAYNAGGLVEQAGDYFLRAYESDPTEVTSLRNAAKFADQDGDLERAKELFERTYAAAPNHRDVIIEYTTFLLKHRGAAEAREILERAVEDFPGDADLWAKAGDARLVLDDVEGARAAYTRALEIEPQQPSALVRLPELNRSAAK